MKESEVIIINGIDDEEFDIAFQKALKYALLSLPFTFNRLSLNDFERRIHNILKGKLAEELFEIFAIHNGLGFDFHSTKTHFTKPDKRDYIHGHTEWDLKNNFLNHIGEYWYGKYTSLPALIPDHTAHSQWNKRDEMKNEGQLYSGFVFSFMKITSKWKGDFYSIQLTTTQKQFLIKEYKSVKDKIQIFDDKKFLESLGTIDYHIRKKPYLVLTGMASQQSDWMKFKKTSDKNMNFGQGVFRTKIFNQAVEISKLDSFYSRYFKDGRILKKAMLKPKASEK